MSQKIAAVLRRAAELIDTPEKWCQGYYRMPSGSGVQRCASAAISDAANEAKIYSGTAERPLRRILKWRRIEDWNDSRHRTHAEVLATLRAAADSEERNG